jgi:hypothetical protein
MARHRRRRRRLGSPPEIHAGLAREQTKAARWWFREARRKTSERKCAEALDALVTAVTQSAAATTNRRGAKDIGGRRWKRGTRVPIFQPVIRKAQARFLKACVGRR